MPDIQEAKCFEFTVKILPSPKSFYGRAKKNLPLCAYLAPPKCISVYALDHNVQRSTKKMKYKDDFRRKNSYLFHYKK